MGPSSRSINVLPSGQVPKYLTMTVGNIGRFEQKLREEEDKLGIAPGDRVGMNFIYIHYYKGSQCHVRLSTRDSGLVCCCSAVCA